jgi:serine protease Do
LVSKIFAGSPAELAGLQVGDVLTKVGGMTVKDIDTLPRAILKLPLNKPVEVTYVRDGKPHTRTVTLEEQPKDYGLRAAARPEPPIAPDGPNEVIEVERAGASVTDLTPALRQRLGYPRGSRGALVVGVSRNSPAAGIGLMRGMLVVKVDDTAVESAKQFAEAVAAASAERGALVQVLRPSGEADFAVLKVK